MRPSVVAIVVSVGMSACGMDPSSSDSVEAVALSACPAELPPAPRGLNPDAIAMVDVNGARDSNSRHSVAAMRTTPDGRIGMNVKVANNNTQLEWFLLHPEQTTGSHDGAMAPQRIVLNLRTADITFAAAPGQTVPTSSTIAIRSIALCNSHAAPRNKAGRDVYALAAIGFTGNSPDRPAQTFLLTATATVSSPKRATASMAISNVRIRRGYDVNVMTLLEPMLTDDGQLLVGRIGNSLLPGYGAPNATYDIVYGYNAHADGFCSDAGFDAFFTDDAQPFAPILKASQDVAVSARYGFASRAWRDAINQPLLAPATPDAAMPNLSGSYPWIDRNGRNLFYYALNSVNTPNGISANSRWPYQCLPGQAPGVCDSEMVDRTRGLSVVGAWTNGKTVLLDGRINNVDVGVGFSPDRQKLVELYQGGVAVRFASGRQNDDRYVGTTTSNMTFVDSIESTHNGYRAWQPTFPREVVWRMSRGHIDDEVAFDDYIDPNVMLYAPMNGVVDPQQALYFDGYAEAEPPVCQATANRYRGGNQVRVQNAATRPPAMGPSPSAGIIVSRADAVTAARIEPAALGGVVGRGLFVPANAALVFPLDNTSTDGCAGACTDSDSRSKGWYASVFLDLPAASAPLLALQIVDRWELEITSATQLTVRVPSDRTGAVLKRKFATPPLLNRWVHVGLLWQPATAKLTVFVDGNPVDTLGLNEAQDAMAATWSSSLQVLAPVTQGMWIDELKVVLNADHFATNLELPCNHALGSMYADSNGALTCIQTWLGASAAGKTSHRGWYLGTQKLAGEALVSVVKHNAPRPNFSSNAFCSSCHPATGKDPERSRALGADALRRTSQLAADDPRRMPMAPPRWVTGNFAAGMYDGGMGTPPWPSADQACATDECNTDREFLFPAK